MDTQFQRGKCRFAAFASVVLLSSLLLPFGKGLAHEIPIAPTTPQPRDNEVQADKENNKINTILSLNVNISLVLDFWKMNWFSSNHF
jgi:hypothetical protein